MKYVNSEPTSLPKEPERVLVWDWSRGEIIDVTTGEVVDRIYVSEIPMREDSDKLVPDIEFVTPADELHPLHLSWSSYTLLEEIVDAFAKLKEVYPVHCSIYLFEDTVRRYLKKISSTRNLRGKEFVAAFIYVALEENNVPVDMYSLSKALGIQHADLKSAILHVKSVLGKNVLSFEEKTRRNIAMYGQKLNLEPKVVADAMEIYDKVRFSGRFTPRIVALTMLYLSLLKNGRSVKPLASVVRLVKLKKVARYVRDTYGICGEVR
ncbi:MAG: hypothetical protein QW584_01640 [Thermofilaceae archaeon]